MVPQKYVKLIGDSIVFNKAIFVDRHNGTSLRWNAQIVPAGRYGYESVYYRTVSPAVCTKDTDRHVRLTREKREK